MKRRIDTIGVCLCVLAGVATGCGDQAGEPHEQTERTETAHQAVVTPEVHLDGVESVFEQIDGLEPEAMTVELWLHPADEETAGATSACSTSLQVSAPADTVAVAGDDSVLSAPAGSYDVDILVVPQQETDGGSDADIAPQLMMSSEEHDGEDSDGSPLPLPADVSGDGEEWGALFAVATHAGPVIGTSVRDVHLAEGDHIIEFDADVTRVDLERFANGDEDTGEYTQTEDFQWLEGPETIAWDGDVGDWFELTHLGCSGE